MDFYDKASYNRFYQIIPALINVHEQFLLIFITEIKAEIHYYRTLE